MRRVSTPDGILAVWCYQLHKVTPAIDAILHRLYEDILGTYWPPERKLVEEGYKTLPFPFAEIDPPAINMTAQWNLPRLEGYLGTWSSSQRYRAQRGDDPLDLIRAELASAWGDPAQERRIVWPLHVRVGRVHA